MFYTVFKNLICLFAICALVSFYGCNNEKNGTSSEIATISITQVSCPTGTSNITLTLQNNTDYVMHLNSSHYAGGKEVLGIVCTSGNGNPSGGNNNQWTLSTNLPITYVSIPAQGSTTVTLTNPSNPVATISSVLQCTLSPYPDVTAGAESYVAFSTQLVSCS